MVYSVYIQCGERSTSHGSTPAFPRVPGSAGCGRCRSAAQLLSSTWSPETVPYIIHRNNHINQHFISIVLNSSYIQHINHRGKNTGHWHSVSRGKRDCTHRHLHLELILVKLEEDVRECALQEGGGPQNQNQLEVPWEGALKWESRWRPSLTQQSREGPPLPRVNYTSHLSRKARTSYYVFLCVPCENCRSNTFKHVHGVNKRMGNVGDVGRRPVAGTLIFVSFMMVLHESWGIRSRH